ncbi:MAG: Lrp/AsnC family transcriptional regulator [Clostridia bacterium]|nr:Lrp/AsnC family transcriptional regulator [Clostridia bacterium]
MEEELLKLLEKNCRLTDEQISRMLGKEQGDLRCMMQKLEDDKVILAYKAIVDWDKVEHESVNALIELKITPQRDQGFDRVAKKIYNYPEVESLYLMSGGYDLCVQLRGKTMKEVAYFVARKLAVMDEVVSTATHFVLKKYKDTGVIFESATADERGNMA